MITIYGNSVCMWCEKAKDLAERYGLEFEYRNVDEDRYMNEFKINFPSARTIPQIKWGNRYIGGYGEFAEEVENTLGGYGDGKL